MRLVIKSLKWLFSKSIPHCNYILQNDNYIQFSRLNPKTSFFSCCQLQLPYQLKKNTNKNMKEAKKYWTISLLFWTCLLNAIHIFVTFLHKSLLSNLLINNKKSVPFLNIMELQLCKIQGKHFSFSKNVLL